MSLAAKLEAAKPVRKSQFESYVDGLSDEDREALLEAAHDTATWSTNALLRVLKDEVPVGKDTLSAWRSRVTG